MIGIIVTYNHTVFTYMYRNNLEQGSTLKYIHLWQFQTETSSELKTKNFF